MVGANEDVVAAEAEDVAAGRGLRPDEVVTAAGGAEARRARAVADVDLVADEAGVEATRIDFRFVLGERELRLFEVGHGSLLICIPADHRRVLRPEWSHGRRDALRSLGNSGNAGCCCSRISFDAWVDGSR